VKAKGLAFTDDRKCKQCGERYTPPTPAWGGPVFLISGIVLALMGGGLLAWSALDTLLFNLGPESRSGVGAPVNGCAFVFMAGELGIFLLGVFSAIHGVKTMIKGPPRVEDSLHREGMGPAPSPSTPQDGGFTGGESPKT
jgi:hypothetical protein